MAKVKKWRHRTWRWGQYIFWNGEVWVDEDRMEFSPVRNLNMKDMEEYIEAEHGEHMKPVRDEDLV